MHLVETMAYAGERPWHGQVPSRRMAPAGIRCGGLRKVEKPMRKLRVVTGYDEGDMMAI